MNFNRIFNSENKIQALVILLVSLMVLVVIVCIYSLVVIWLPKDEKEVTKKELVIGKYETKTILEEDVVKTYFSKIYALMINGEYKELYEMLDPLFISKYKITEENLGEYINKKGINKIGLVLEKYEKTQIDNYSNVYTLQVTTSDKSIIERIVVKEYSPSNIVVAFDNYLAYEITSTGIIKDGLKFILNNIELNNNQYTITASITNVTDNTIILNKNKDIYAIKVITDKNSLISTVSDTITGQAIEIKAGETYNYKGIFSKLSTFNSIKGINIVSIYYTDSNRYAEVTYDL